MRILPCWNWRRHELRRMHVLRARGGGAPSHRAVLWQSAGSYASADAGGAQGRIIGLGERTWPRPSNVLAIRAAGCAGRIARMRLVPGGFFSLACQRSDKGQISYFLDAVVSFGRALLPGLFMGVTWRRAKKYRFKPI